MGTSIALALASLGFAAGDPAAEFKAEMKRLKGIWLVLTTERNGEVRREPRTLWVFDGASENATVHWTNRPHNVAEKDWTFAPNRTNMMLTYVFDFNPSKALKEIDRNIRFNGQKETGKPLLGIYKIEGDKLTICLADHYGGGKRPTEFTAKKDSNRQILVLVKESEK